ncbi:MAG: terpene cyclase/mutase family protein, partial [Acidobacteria bacterium]|nr:terpene cyclase/mutase family protein [Acidobacteriota bacterium]
MVRQRVGPDTGDDSNSQYAALGLRACYDGGIDLPVDVLAKAEKRWRSTRMRNGGWNYGTDGPAYGSMTAGAVGALVLYDYILKRPWKKDADVLAGLQWLASNFSVERIPGAQEPAQGFLYYYLYALERACLLYGTETLGQHKWYAEGAGLLLRQQKPDGSWSAGMPMPTASIWDTSFAILFLRRATRPPVATGDRFSRPKDAPEPEDPKGKDAKPEGQDKDPAQQIQGKIKTLQEGIQKWQKEGRDPSPIGQIMQEFGPLMEAGKAKEAEAVLDRALKLLQGSEKEEPQGKEVKPPPAGRLEIELERVATGFQMAEGPAWDGESLHFSDVPPSKILK